jgi:hypothetical protein
MAKGAIAQNLTRRLEAERAAKSSLSAPAPTAESIGISPTQRMLNTLLGGRTSTVLTGYFGEDQEKLRTSKILLGGG